MSLLVPHAPQCVHKNLHKSGRKCQYTQSMVIRRSQEHSCLPGCDVKLAESSFSANKYNSWWIIFLHVQDHSRFSVAVMYEGKTEKFWGVWARRTWPLLFLTGFWELPMSQQEVHKVRLHGLSSPRLQDWKPCLPLFSRPSCTLSLGFSVHLCLSLSQISCTDIQHIVKTLNQTKQSLPPPTQHFFYCLISCQSLRETSSAKLCLIHWRKQITQVRITLVRG